MNNRFTSHRGGYMSEIKRRIMKTMFGNLSENHVFTSTKNNYNYTNINYGGMCLSKKVSGAASNFVVTGSGPVVKGVTTP